MLTEQTSLHNFRVEISAAITQHKTLKVTLKHCTDAIVKHLDVAFARIWILNHEENMLELQASSGIYTHINGNHGRIPLGKFKIGLIAEERQPHLTNDVLNDPRVGNKDWARREGMVAFAGYPLILDDQTIGVIGLFSRHFLSDSILDALELAANQIALSTKHLQTEQALQESEKKYRYLVETSQDVIWSTDIQGRWTFLNKAVKNIYGYEPEEMIGHHYSEFEPSTQQEKSSAFFQRVLVEQYVAQYETVVIAKNGQQLNLMCNASIYRDEIGNIIGITGTATNITQIKQVESNLRESQIQLRKQTQQLEETLLQLKHSQSQLIHHEKMSSLGLLVAGIAHEINNPINFIYGNIPFAQKHTENLLLLLELYNRQYPQPPAEIQDFAQVIELEFIKSDLGKIFQSIQLGSDRIRETVLSLRNFSRLDEAEIKLVDIHQGIDSTLMILQNQLQANCRRPAIEVIKDYGQIPLIECYPRQINQVLMNILLNAIDGLDELVSQEETRVSYQIHIHTEMAAADRMIIRIIDNGFGIPEAIQQKIFYPFFTTKQVGKGKGIGLAISYQIITETHGGSLQCFSQIGQGTEFRITIPVQH